MKKIPTPSFKAPSAFKFGASMNNLVLMLLFSFTMFVMFRYIKTLEKDVKRLREKIDMVETHQQLIDTNRFEAAANNAPSTFPPWRASNNETEATPSPTCTRLSEECKIATTNADNSVHVAHGVYGDHGDHGDGDDGESVNSEVLMQMVSDLDHDEEEQDAQPVGHLPASDVNETNEQPDEIDEVIQDQEDDEFVMKPKKGKVDQESSLDALKKKTNDELKKLLKDQGKSIKGTKQELINRLMEEDA